MLALRAAAWALQGDFDRAIPQANEAIRWGRLSGSQPAEWQAFAVTTFLARQTGRSLDELLEPNYAKPGPMALVSLLGQEDRAAARRTAAPHVRTFFENRKNPRGTSLETVGIMVEWAVFELDEPELRTAAAALLAECSQRGVRTFVGWPRRFDEYR